MRVLFSDLTIVIKVGDEFFLELSKGKESVVVEVPQGPEFIGQLPDQQLTPVRVPTVWTVAIHTTVQNMLLINA